MAVLTAAAVLSLASAYTDWSADWVVWQVFSSGDHGNGESSGRTDVIDPSGKYVGLMQIDYRLHGYTIEQMQDPVQNIAAAHKLWLARGTQPWPSAVKYQGGQQMGVTADGWLTWVEKMPGRPATGNGFNAGVNAVKGLVFHSAEGWATTMLSKTSQWGYYSAEYPWHLSNLLDGRLIQHYPFTARCWHGSAFNNDYVGMEHEGVSPEPGKGPLLNAGQVANAKRVAADLGTWKGWTPRRPTKTGDLTASLYEHKETVWFGGTSTSCPNNRIPWDLILQPAQEEDMATEHYDGELNARRAFVGLMYNLTTTTQIRYSADGKAFEFINPADQTVIGKLPAVVVPDWAKPT